MQYITSDSMRVLLVACVCLPLCLAIASIFSTHLDVTLQSQPVAGIPLFLWLWLSVSLSICAILMWVGSRLNYQDSDFITADKGTSPALSKQVNTIDRVAGDSHD